MTADSHANGDPFADPTVMAAQRSFAGDSTLNVGRNISLTLGAESLILLDEGFVDQPRFNCFGLISKKSTRTRAIPYFNVLWASADKVEITIQYAQPSSKTDVSVAYINYPLDHTEEDTTESAKMWTEKLLNRAYGAAQRKKRIKVLLNPFGGAGKAGKLFTRDIQPVFAAARCELDVETTQHSGHAAEIAEDIDIGAFDVIACCSGDGTPHEVFNGLGKRSNAVEALSRLAVVNIPCGSGNAMSWNLFGTGSPSMAALCAVKGLRMPLDLISVTQGNRRYLSFLSQSFGIIAECDLGTDNIRWMGAARFTFGFLVRLLGKITYPCDVAVKIEIDDKASIKSHYRSSVSSKEFREESDSQHSYDAASSSRGLPALQYGTPSSPLSDLSGWTPLTHLPHLGNLYSGNMCYVAASVPFFSCALPSDGLLDFVTINGNIPRLTALKTFLAAENNTLIDLKHCRYQKVSAYRVIPRYKKGYISIDGESIPFEPFQTEVHRGLGCVLSRKGRFYESEGPREDTKRR